jgi:hypothetical protein
MSKSACGLEPDCTVMTGILASFAALNWASASTGLPMAMTMASTFLAISASNCSACLGSEPSELSRVTPQPLALAAAAAALATRAWVSEENWKPMMPSSNACAPWPKASSATAEISNFLKPNMVFSPRLL